MIFWRLKRKIHTSWLICITCFSVIMGVFLSRYFKFPITVSTVIFMFAALLIGLSFWKKIVCILPVLIIGGILLGFWRGSLMQNDLVKFSSLYGHVIYVNGIVKDDVDISTSNSLTIRLSDLVIDNKKMLGDLWIMTVGSDIKRGDRLLLQGNLIEGFGNFSGIMYRAKVDKIIHPQPGDIARVVRDWFADAIRLAIPEPEASLGIGYLVGQRRALSADLITVLQIAGLTHIVVASGYNLTILVRMARRLFVKISKYLSTLSASAMIFVFIAITGLSPSMLRAGLVTGLSLAAWYYGRKLHPIVLLSIVAALTLMINPSYVWGDLGWQLSFAAFAGVMIVAPLAQKYFFGNDKPGMIQQILIETIAAQIVTAPILISAFGQFSNVAIISNLLVLPLVPLAMLLTFIAGVGGLIVPPLALFIGLPATWLMHYMISAAEYLAGLPWAMSVFVLSWWGVLLCYLIIAIGCIYLWRVTKYNLREVNLVE